MKRMQRAKLAAAYLLLALAAALGWLYSCLPDRIYLEPGQALYLPRFAWVEPQRGHGSQNVASTRAVGSYQTTLTLGGWLPIKTIRAVVTERPRVTVCGTPFGVKMFSEGALIVGFSEIGRADGGTSNPAKEAGLRLGDRVICIGQTRTESNDAVKEALDAAGGQSVEVVYIRSGEIVPCEITGCSAGTAGSPGELKGHFLSAHAIGTIRINGENGVYGTTRTHFSGQLREIAFAQEVVTGPAEIWATIEGETPRAYRIQIERVSDADPRRNLVIRVTDPSLLSATGGIVQGMSGSPILQNGRLVGAVTHVLVNDPTRGYGIFAQTMLEQAKNAVQNDAEAQIAE